MATGTLLRSHSGSPMTIDAQSQTQTQTQRPTITSPDTNCDFDLDSLLDLESTYEAQGHADGLRDGRAQAHTSAKLFGLEKGWEKYLPMAQLRWRAERYAEMYGVPIDPAIALSTPGSSSSPSSADSKPVAMQSDDTRQQQHASRLQKHITTLLALTSANTLTYLNTDEAIGDFEERLKRAQAKCKVLERMLGGDGGAGGNNTASVSVVGDGDIENPRLNLGALGLG